MFCLFVRCAYWLYVNEVEFDECHYIYVGRFYTNRNNMCIAVGVTKDGKYVAVVELCISVDESIYNRIMWLKIVFVHYNKYICQLLTLLIM